MSKLDKDSFIELLKSMNIKEVMSLVEAMKEEFGIDPTAVVASGPSGVEEAVKTEVTVTLKSIGGNKVSVIKVVKEITSLGLMDAKKMVESAPVAIKENIKPEEAEEISKKLIDAGAEVSVD